MYTLIIKRDELTRLHVTNLSYEEYNNIMKYLLKTLPNDIQAEVSFLRKLEKETLHNEHVPPSDGSD